MTQRLGRRELATALGDYPDVARTLSEIMRAPTFKDIFSLGAGLGKVKTIARIFDEHRQAIQHDKVPASLERFCSSFAASSSAVSALEASITRCVREEVEETTSDELETSAAASEEEEQDAPEDHVPDATPAFHVRPK
jgi:DNA mismatch repair ATPase MutS